MPRDPLPSEAPIANPNRQPVPSPVLAGAGCQFIVAEMSAEGAGKCGLPVVWRSSYCRGHHRRCLRPALPYGYLLRLAGLPETGQPEIETAEWPGDRV